MMQPKQMQNRQFTKQTMTPRAMTPRQMTPREMTISTSRQDMRQMFIPAGTIVEEPPRKIRFAYLRSWLLGLISLVLLPIGLLFVLVGTEMSESLTRDWVETTATVEDVRGASVIYTYQANNIAQSGVFSQDLQSYIRPSANGQLLAQVRLCDIIAPVMIPKSRGATFSLWYDAQDSEQHQCLPMSRTAGSGFVIAGWIMVLFALWTLIRIFHRAGIQLARQ
jgi:hypothetical protein